MDFEALRVDAFELDTALTDPGEVGAELAASAGAYLATPRALVWRHPSPDWPLFVLLLPLASRLSLMANPIFGALVRDWGHGIRFLGIDRDQCVHDFRSLLTDQTLRRLVESLAHWLNAASPRQSAIQRAAEANTLDVLFAALGEATLTVLEARRDFWGEHLARTHRLEPEVDGSLFDRAHTLQDFLAQLRQALRLERIDVNFYGRVLRSIDLREAAVEQRIAALIEGALDPVTLVKLGRTPAGRHLGAYNWLLTGPRHAAQRADVLGKLPLFTQAFADLLIEGPAASAAGLIAEALHDPRSPNTSTTDRDARARLRQAIDSGQDRWIIQTLAEHFDVHPSVLRMLWRHCPSVLNAPPTWHLKQILLQLNNLPTPFWPLEDEDWLELAQRAVPAVLG